MTLWEKIQGAYNDPKSVYYFVQAYYRIFLERIGYLNYDLKSEIIDRKLHLAKKCTKNGACLACGCKTPDLYYANKACSAPKWLGQDACYPELQNTPIKRCKAILKVGKRTGIKLCKTLMARFQVNP